MAINFENLIIDQVDQVIFQNSNNEVIGALNQLEDLSINTSTETKDKTDARGILIKRFYTAKSVEVSGTNALVSLDALAMQFGTTKKIASATDKIIVPMILQYSKDDFKANKINLPIGIEPIAGTVAMNNVTRSGVPDTTYKYEFVATDVASTTKKAKLTTTEVDSTGATIEIGADNITEDFEGVQIIFDYEADAGIQVDVEANKFPASCKATFSVLCCDPCEVDVLRHAYVVFPSFQVSGDVDWTLTTDATQAFSGVAQLDYCSGAKKKRLFYIVMSDNDIVQ